MNRDWRPKHFSLDELVDRVTLESHGENAWKLLDLDLVYAIDMLREYHGMPVTCNSWAIGGTFNWRGYRPRYCTIGATRSMHREGCAFDLDMQGLSAEGARDLVRKLYREGRHGWIEKIRRIETGVNWLHVDSKGGMDQGLVEFAAPKVAKSG